MMDCFVWNGVKSTDYGIYVLQQPDIILPAERIEFIDVPGRSGSLAVCQGEDVFDDITLSFTCFVENVPNLSHIGAYLRGEGELRLPLRDNGYYQARIINQISFTKILRGNAARSFAVNFRCKPLFRLDSGEYETELTSGGIVVNPTELTAKPEITVTGSGDITLTVGGETVELAGISEGIILDSELQEAYYGGTLKNSQMTGRFPVLGAGSTAISWSGSVSSVTIKPKWVMI